MNILVLYDTEIKAWLVGEPLEAAPLHIQNGYPELLDAWQAETVMAEVIDVPDEKAFSPELYAVVGGSIQRL